MRKRDDESDTAGESSDGVLAAAAERERAAENSNSSSSAEEEVEIEHSHVDTEVLFAKNNVFAYLSRNMRIAGRLTLVKQHCVVFLAWIPYDKDKTMTGGSDDTGTSGKQHHHQQDVRKDSGGGEEANGGKMNTIDEKGSPTSSLPRGGDTKGNGENGVDKRTSSGSSTTTQQHALPACACS